MLVEEPLQRICLVEPPAEPDAEPDDESAPGELHAAILAHLEARGASFLTEIERAVLESGDFERREIEPALWDLVWAGQVTNDTFQPLRTLGSARSRHRRSRGRAATLAAGRWSLVSSLGGAESSPTS